MKRTLISATVLGIVLVAFVVGRSLAADEHDVERRNALAQEVFFAVLEGLYEDGVSTEDVDHILRQNQEGHYIHFVGGCPLCIPSLNAFRIYQPRLSFVGYKRTIDTFGAGLSEIESRGLASDQPKERMEVLHALLKRWVGRRLDRKNLSEAERERWNAAIKQGRDEGTKMLRGEAKRAASEVFDEVDACAICEGAAGACEQR